MGLRGAERGLEDEIIRKPEDRLSLEERNGRYISTKRESPGTFSSLRCPYKTEPITDSHRGILAPFLMLASSFSS